MQIIENFNLVKITLGLESEDLDLFLKTIAGIDYPASSRFWIAGGSLRRIFCKQKTIGVSDFDLFFSDENIFNAFLDGLEKLEFELVKDTKENVSLKKGDILVQLIRIAYYKDVESLLNSFDFTLCQLAIQGGNLNTLYCSDTALFDIGRKRIVVNKITYPVSSVRRLIKYSNQGFYACSGTIKSIFNSVVLDNSLLNDNKVISVD